jgi:hypothetical protein
MTPSELREIGDQHGRGWQTRLARELPVNVRTVRRWLAGRTQMHEAIERRVKEIMAGWQ